MSWRAGRGAEHRPAAGGPAPILTPPARDAGGRGANPASPSSWPADPSIRGPAAGRQRLLAAAGWRAAAVPVRARRLRLRDWGWVCPGEPHGAA